MGENVHIYQVVPGRYDAQCHRCYENGDYETKDCLVCLVDIPCNFNEHVFLCEDCAKNWASCKGDVLALQEKDVESEKKTLLNWGICPKCGGRITDEAVLFSGEDWAEYGQGCLEEDCDWTGDVLSSDMDVNMRDA